MILMDYFMHEFLSLLKVVVHEWVHLRYGIADEYPTTVHFYNDINGEVQAVKCSKAIPREHILHYQVQIN